MVVCTLRAFCCRASGSGTGADAAAHRHGVVERRSSDGFPLVVLAKMSKLLETGGRASAPPAVESLRSTVNASLGPDTPREFDPGLHGQEDINLNFDVSYPVSDRVNVAAGTEWRDESFESGVGGARPGRVGSSCPRALSSPRTASPASYTAVRLDAQQRRRLPRRQKSDSRFSASIEVDRSRASTMSMHSVVTFSAVTPGLAPARGRRWPARDRG